MCPEVLTSNSYSFLLIIERDITPNIPHDSMLDAQSDGSDSPSAHKVVAGQLCHFIYQRLSDNHC